MKDLHLGRNFYLPLDVVTEATGIVATRGAGKSSCAAALVEEALGSEIPTVVMDWTGVFWGLRSNADGTGAGLGIYVLGGPHGDVPLEVHAGSLIADLVVDSGHSFVLDLSDFTKGQMRRFSADFLERLYERKARARTTLLLVIDEAHELAPQSPRGGFKGDAARLIAAMEQVVALGRSRGIGAVLITQRTQALNKAVLDLIETLIVMRMLSPRAVAAVKEWISIKNEDDEAGVLPSLPDLPTGTAWFWSPLRGILRKVAIRRIRTFDSYRTPKPGEVAVVPKERKEVDLEALGEQMRATAERVKAEDPVILRRRISELEAQLASRPPEQIEVAVEVFRVPDFLGPRLRDVSDLVGPLVKQAEDVRKAFEEIEDEVAEVVGAPVEEFRAEKADRSPGIPRPSEPPPPRPTSPAISPNGTSDVTRPQQRILDALASLEAIGVPVPDKKQLALFVGVSPTSGGYFNNLGTLRSLGLIEYPSPGAAALTPEGRVVADGSRAPRTVGDLHELIRNIIKPASFKVLQPLIDAYPDAIQKDSLAGIVGVSPTSGGYFNTLGKLRSLGLVDYPQPGYAVATPIVFLEAGARA